MMESKCSILRSPSEWDISKVYIDVMSELDKALREACGGNYVTSSLIIPLISNLNAHIGNCARISEDHSRLSLSLKKAMDLYYVSGKLYLQLRAPWF